MSTEKKHKSDSAVQRAAEKYLIACLGESLGIPLAPRRIKLDRSCVDLDGFYEDDSRVVMAEAFSRVDTELLAGQKKKVATDILKFMLLESFQLKASCGKDVRKFLVFASDTAAKYVFGKAWPAIACRHFGVEVFVVTVPESLRAELAAAQKLQDEGMRTGAKEAGN